MVAAYAVWGVSEFTVLYDPWYEFMITNLILSL